MKVYKGFAMSAALDQAALKQIGEALTLLDSRPACKMGSRVGRQGARPDDSEVTAGAGRRDHPVMKSAWKVRACIPSPGSFSSVQRPGAREIGNE